MRHAFAPALLAAAALFASGAHAADQTREVDPFTSVSNTGAADVTIEVGKTQSVVASGSENFLNALVTEVVDGQLRIRFKDKNLGNSWSRAKIAITVPRLTAYAMAGAGESAITHMSGDSLEIRFAGAGSLKADGSVAHLRLQVGGVGSIDLRELHAEDARVDVGGVGSVKVWASTRLAASVGGVGALTYYGNPKTVDARGGGLGSISRGD